jgi:hypothetical protein
MGLTLAYPNRRVSAGMTSRIRHRTSYCSNGSRSLIATDAPSAQLGFVGVTGTILRSISRNEHVMDQPRMAYRRSRGLRVLRASFITPWRL